MPEELTKYFDICKSRIDEIFSHPEKYGYEPNFLDRERGAGWENFTPAHQAVLLDRFAFVYAANIDEIHRLKSENESFDVISYVAEKAIPLGIAGTEEENKNLYRDKLMSRDGFILELPGDSANVTAKELENRTEIFEALGLDAKAITLRNKLGHSTYDQPVAEVEGRVVTVKDIFPGALQGVHRKLVPKDQVTLMREAISEAIQAEHKKEVPDNDRLDYLQKSLLELEGKKDERKFNAGSQVFVPHLNAGKASPVVGPELIDFGMSVHQKNVTDVSPSFKGFAAGISGNAMHYALSGTEFSRQVLGKEMSDSDQEKVYKVVESHLVGTDQAPLHHSTPETRMGWELGVAFADVVDKGEERRLTKDALLETVREASDVAADYTAEVKARIKEKEKPVVTADNLASMLHAAAANVVAAPDLSVAASQIAGGIKK